jgi:hypothetical protein
LVASVAGQPYLAQQISFKVLVSRVTGHVVFGRFKMSGRHV